MYIYIYIYVYIYIFIYMYVYIWVQGLGFCLVGSALAAPAGRGVAEEEGDAPRGGGRSRREAAPPAGEAERASAPSDLDLQYRGYSKLMTRTAPRVVLCS